MVLTSYLEQLSKTIYSCKINRRDYLKTSGVKTKKSSILLMIGKHPTPINHKEQFEKYIKC